MPGIRFACPIAVVFAFAACAFESIGGGEKLPNLFDTCWSFVYRAAAK